MAYKTILVHCDASPKVGARLAVAVDLAQRSEARLVGVHVRAPFEAPAFFDGTMPMDSLFESYETASSVDEKAAKAAFDKALKGTQIASEWRVADGYVDEQLEIQARYADLMVLGQTDYEVTSPIPEELPEAVVLATGRPALVVPHIGAPKTLGKTVMLCWNASRESARAASDAMPLLKQADKVIVLLVDAKSTETGHGDEPGADVATWLTRHGVKVSVQCDVAADSDVGGPRQAHAADVGVDMIVMGLYGHSRLREMVLGGASRTLLASMTVPVLMAH